MWKSLKKIDYSSYEEFEIKIRKLLHPILIEINNKVSIRDIELEVREALKDIQENFCPCDSFYSDCRRQGAGYVGRCGEPARADDNGRLHCSP